MDFLGPFTPYYYILYLIFAMTLTLGQFNVMKKKRDYAIIRQSYSYKPLVFFSIFFIVFWGLRPLGFGCFGDTKNYYETYTLIQDYGIFNMNGDTEASKDPLFYMLMFICAHIMDPHLFFTICIFFYVSMMFSGCRKVDYRHGTILMLFCYGAFEFYPYAVNGIRNGMACSFVIMALAYLCRNKKLMSIVLSLGAIGFHKSALLPVVAMFFSFYISKAKYMYIVWFGAIIISLAIGSYIDDLLTILSFDNRMVNNLQNDEADGMVLEHRFRWDFLLYSFLPIILGWYTVFKRKLFNKTYLILLGTYMYSNAFWILAIRAMYSNRIAYLSWFIYPIVLAYPLMNFPVFKHKHSEKTAWILLGHFCFTTILWLLGKL